MFGPLGEQWKQQLKREVKRQLQQRLGPLFPQASVAVSQRPTLFALLGIGEDSGYAAAASSARNATIGTLSRCSPPDTTPEALAGYISEAALRIFRTTEWLGECLAELGAARPRVLEIGSNPYFQTLLIAERFPQVEHLGVNYFGAASPYFETQQITDAQKRLSSTRFYHADIERHDLAPTGEFDVALFCEVLEHLPYDPAWALWNVLRRVKPGGHLILTTPNPARLENLVKMIEQRETFSDPISGFGIHGRHNREYSARELKELVEGGGAKVVAQKTVDVLPDAHSRDAEARGYGAYHMLRAVLHSEARLFRPAWLYRSYADGQLAQAGPLLPR